MRQADVVVVRADVGEGKSKLAEAVVRFVASARCPVPGLRSAAIGVPNNVLLDQYLATCRGLDTLKAQDRYRCINFDEYSCAEKKRIIGSCCRSASGSYYASDSCPYLRDLRRSRSAKKLVMTYHALLAHDTRKDVLVFDEAHNLRPFLQGMAAKRLWKHEYRWRGRIDSVEAALKWLEGEYQGDTTEATDLLWATLTGPRPQYVVDFSPQDWRGQRRECISLVPVDVRKESGFLSKPKKVVLLSATINRLDIASLGLDKRRVAYIEMPSSIPPENRQIIYEPVADMRHSKRKESVDAIVDWLLLNFLPYHAHKGLIHATYEVADLLRRIAHKFPSNASRRLLFHDSGNKQAVLTQFIESDPAEGLVLVGSGMHEGVDLYGDRARWQVITQVPRPNIGDPATAWLADNQPEAYEWETVRGLVQAAGRVCRGPDDWGHTYIVDSSFGDREAKSELLPASFKEALIWR